MNKTDSFNVKDFLPYLLNQAAETTSREFQKQYKDRYGMLRTEWRVLFHLGKYDTLNANDIVKMAGIHKTKISRAVDALNKKGFLKRNVDPLDRRKETLALTERGKHAYLDLSVKAESYEKQLVEELSAKDVEMFKKLLKRFASSL